MTHPQRSDTTTLYLIRHGATDANMQRPYVLQGTGVNLGLNSVGRSQAAAVGQFLRTRPIDHVYASPLLRAVETAQAVAEFHRQQVATVEPLLEVDVGQWEGLDWDTIMSRHPEAYRAFMDNPAENPYLGGESYSDVHRRAQPAIQDLLERHMGQTLAVVAHNVVNRVVLAGLLGLDIAKAKGVRQENGCINVIRYRPGETTAITINAVFHLEDAAFA